MKLSYISYRYKEDKALSPCLPSQCVEKVFEREVELPRLIGLWPSELTDYSREGTEAIIALIRKALRIERKRSQNGHWGYDLNRHLALSNALKMEKARISQLSRDKTSI